MIYTVGPTKKILAVIPARGGSKGVIRKNIRPIGGKPLIAYTIETALAARHLLHRAIVSTDDSEIEAIARNHGADVPFQRPAELAGDQVPTAAGSPACSGIYRRTGWRQAGLGAAASAHGAIADVGRY